MTSKKIDYKSSGVDYAVLDNVKIKAQNEAQKTGNNLIKDFSEITQSRGESAYIFKNKNTYYASVVEGLGTKNLIADQMHHKKTYYDIIGYDTVATIINDLTTVGASPLVINAYWAVGESSWFLNTKRSEDLIRGWKNACDFAKVSWGGGETPTLKGIVEKNACDLGGSALGIIKKKPLLENNLSKGDRIILLKSNGINANGITLAREIASRLPLGYKTKIGKRYYGDLLLRKTNIYSNLISDLLEKNIDLHYITNITGHGLRKIMRPKRQLTYVLNSVFPKPSLFDFMQKAASLSDHEAYATWNMGQDYAIFLQEKYVKKTLRIINNHGFVGIDAGHVETGKKQIIIKEKNIVYNSDALKIR